MSAARRLSVIAVIAAVVCAGPAARVDAAGDPAPNVELRGPKGQRQRLADFRGKIVLLKIWASWCPDCKVLFPELDRLSREFKSRGVEVIAVNVDEHRKDADAFLKHNHTNCASCSIPAPVSPMRSVLVVCRRRISLTPAA